MQFGRRLSAPRLRSSSLSVAQPRPSATLETPLNQVPTPSLACMGATIRGWRCTRLSSATLKPKKNDKPIKIVDRKFKNF